MSKREQLEEIARRGNPEEWLRVLLHESTRANNAEALVALHKEALEAAEKMRRAVLELDSALTELIGTEKYPDELTSQHFNLRDAAVFYDLTKIKGQPR